MLFFWKKKTCFKSLIFILRKNDYVILFINMLKITVLDSICKIVVFFFKNKSILFKICFAFPCFFIVFAFPGDKIQFKLIHSSEIGIVITFFCKNYLYACLDFAYGTNRKFEWEYIKMDQMDRIQILADDWKNLKCCILSYLKILKAETVFSN